MSMEHNGGNQNLPPPSLCRSGCGFYGSESFEGMCSKCYKDQLKRKQQNPSPSPIAGRSSPSVNNFVETSSSSSFTTPSTSAAMSRHTTPSVETAVPTIPTTLGQSQKAAEQEKTEAEGATGGAEASVSCDSQNGDQSDKGEKKPKKNRCHTCKKKVGLTGFSCRCGGLYCSLHRYSDKHECTFNYKELGQAQIRKQNPVVVSSKIQKI